jgi:excisionase family DNA binding protein
MDVMTEITFEQLPKAVGELFEKLNNIERLLLEQSSTRSPEADALLTIQQAASFLNLAIPTLYSKVSRQEIPCSKNGKRLYFSKAELMDWIRSGKKLTVADIQANTDKHLSQVKRRKQA